MKFIRFITLPIACLATMAMLSGCGDSANITGIDGLDTTPPPAPSELRLTSDASGQLLLTWTESAAPDVAGYEVYVYSPGVGFVEATDVNNADNAFELPTVTENSVYRVRAVDTSGNRSAFSADAEFGTSDPGNGDQTPYELPQ
ncbi:MAG TPA: fibronectin type III domain-containing protein [Candidatus Eisenbacteria bacterium]|nr:fibronectin type III domain-containing protein [Candidatus Eisenbacteria bacterium]